MTTDNIDIGSNGIDADLRADIRRLGVLLGQTLARQEGQSLLDLVEEVRGLVRTDGAKAARRLASVDLTTATQAWPAQACQQAFDPGHGWALSGTGPDYQCHQTFPVTIPGGAGGPLAGHVLQYVASLVSHGAQIVSIIQSHPFVLV